MASFQWSGTHFMPSRASSCVDLGSFRAPRVSEAYNARCSRQPSAGHGPRQALSSTPTARSRWCLNVPEHWGASACCSHEPIFPSFNRLACRQRSTVQVDANSAERDPLNESSNSQAALDAMAQWLKDLGHENCGLALVCSRLEASGHQEAPLAHGTGAVAMRAEGFDAGDVVVSVPRAAMMTEETASRCSDIGALVAKHDLTGWQSLVLHLLWEKRKGPASFWAPYIACLPGMEEMTLSHPLLWPQEVASSLLEGSPMLDTLSSRIQMCIEDAAALVAAGANDIVTSVAPTGPGSFIPDPLVTLQSVRWASAVILSRAFSLDFSDDPHQAFEGENRPPFTLCLVPWADGLNHSSGAGEDSCLAYDPDAQRATLRSHIGYRAGEEVFDSYGPWLSARQLLLDYGFVDAEQTAAIAEVPASAFGPSAGDDNRALVAAVGLPEDGAWMCLTPEGVDDTGRAWLRASLASPAELAEAGWGPQEGILWGTQRLSRLLLQRAETAMATFVLPQSDELEAQVLHRLVHTIEGLLKGYPEESQLAEKCIHQSHASAIRAVALEKEALVGALAVFQSQLADLLAPATKA